MTDNKVITEPSICIPRTLNNVSWRDVKDTMEAVLGKGTVDRVDKRNGTVRIIVNGWINDSNCEASTI